MVDIDKLQSKLLDAITENGGYNMDLFLKYVEDMGKDYNQNINDLSVKIEFTNKSNNPTPDYTNDTNNSINLKAYTNNPISIKPNEIFVISTGLFFRIPKGYEITVRPINKLIIEHSITTLNVCSIIDNNEIRIILINHGDKDFIVNNGDIIAHGVVNQTTSLYTKLVEITK